MIMCDTRQGGDMVVDLSGTAQQLAIEMHVLLTNYARTLAPLVAIEHGTSEAEAEARLLEELHSAVAERLHDLRREREPPEPAAERPKRRRRACSGGGSCPAS